MKKILSLILLALFVVSCGNDNDDNGFNPVQGRWTYNDPLHKYSEVAVFSKSRFASIQVKDGDEEYTYNRGEYTIDENFIYYETYTHQYKIVADTLWIKTATIDQKYVRE